MSTVNRFLFFLVLSGWVFGQPKFLYGGADIQREKARTQAAKKVLDMAHAQYKAGQGNLGTLFFWERRLTESELDLAQNKEEKLKALTDHQKRVQDLKNLADVLYRTGQGNPLIAASANYYVLEAEAWIAKLKKQK